MLKLTTLERTVVDCLDRPDLAGGAEELVNSLGAGRAPCAANRWCSSRKAPATPQHGWLEREQARLGVLGAGAEYPRSGRPGRGGFRGSVIPAPSRETRGARPGPGRSSIQGRRRRNRSLARHARKCPAPARPAAGYRQVRFSEFGSRLALNVSTSISTGYPSTSTFAMWARSTGQRRWQNARPLKRRSAAFLLPKAIASAASLSDMPAENGSPFILLRWAGSARWRSIST